MCSCWKEPTIHGKSFMDDDFMLKIIALCYLKLTAHNEQMNTNHVKVRHTPDMYIFLKHGNKNIINGSLFKEGTMVMHLEAIEIDVQFSCASFACGRKVFLLDNVFESAIVLVIKYSLGALTILPVAFQNYNPQN